MDVDHQVFEALGIALALGLLIGLQRERADEPLGGIRTYPLVTLAGALATILDTPGHPFIFGGGILALAGVMIMGNVARLRAGDASPGVTGEVAMLLAYLIGGAAAAGYLAVAVVTGGITAVLLHLKKWMHAAVDRFSDDDVRAVMQLVVISLIILPLVPDRSFGPYHVFNPFETWLMVVLISALSLAGYVAFRLVGERAGSVVAGLLGGLISSTAATAGFSRQSREGLAQPLAALAIMLASTVLLVRVLIEVSVVGTDLLGAVGPPLGAALAVNVVICGVAFFAVERSGDARIEQKNPAQLKAALVFGALYAVIKLGVAAASDYLGQGALYLVALASGLTDVDAITLSTSQLMQSGRLDPGSGWRLILVAVLANLAFKAGIAGVLGGRRLLRFVALMFGVSLLADVLLILAWPGAIF